MKVTSIALGVLASTATLAVPTVSTAGVRVDVGVLLGAPAYSARDGYDRGYRGDAGRYGYERGYREGTSEGYKDGRKGRRFDFRRDGDYRDADDGYKGWMGPRHVYERGFRRGFEEGYRRAFDAGRRERRDDRRHDRDWDRRDRDDRDRW